MFVRLALRNVQRQIRNYLIYFVTVAFSIALLFSVNNLSYSDRIRALAELSSDIRSMFTMVTVLATLVTAFVLSYVTGFMLKLRKREFGMYLTLGMTRQNIQTLFVCETALMTGLAVIVGMGAGLMIFQLLAALFSAILELSFEVSAYSVSGIILTLVVSAGLFLLSTLVSLRYLKRVTISELLKEEATQKSEKHLILWCCLSGGSIVAFFGCLIETYRSLMATFREQESLGLLVWLAIDLGMVFLTHFTLSRTVAGMLLQSKRLKNRGTNTVVFRGLSGKMTVNSLLIGTLATLLVFAIVMSNVAFGEKVFRDGSIEKECPYDVMAMLQPDQANNIPLKQGEQIIAKHSPIQSQIDYQLYTTKDTALCSYFPGYEEMGWIDLLMPLSQFNALLTGCGYEPITLENEYLMFTDLSQSTVTLNGKTYSWANSTSSYPDFARRAWMFFVVPDEAVEGLNVAYRCAAYTLENHRPDPEALRKDLTWYDDTEEECDYAIQQYIRLYSKANAGVLIIGSLYVSTVFVCMALAILAVKTLSTLEDERRRFEIMYRLGADGRMQKSALFWQIGAFFLMPFLFPLLMTIPMGVVFGKVYTFWNLSGLSGREAMLIAAVIALAVTGIYALYFVITYRIACDHVVCYGSVRQER